ncbi:MAG: GNAT family N-acetyltransferase [Paracoccaceae bacterium]
MTHPWESPLEGPCEALAASVRAVVPVLETDRLRLRAPQVTDFGAYAAIFMSERAVYMDGPYDREGAWADFTQAAAGWVLRGLGLWTMERRSDGAIVGFGYFWQEFGDPEPELGWALSAGAEGQGYASEAAHAMRAHAFAQLGEGRVVSYIDAGNLGSVRIAERLGARRDPELEALIGDPGLTVWRHGAAGGRGADGAMRGKRT